MPDMRKFFRRIWTAISNIDTAYTVFHFLLTYWKPAMLLILPAGGVTVQAYLDGYPWSVVLTIGVIFAASLITLAQKIRDWKGSRPSFAIQVDHRYLMDIGPGVETVFFFMLRVKNTGADSIAEDWRLSVHPAGTTNRLVAMPLPGGVQAFQMRDAVTGASNYRDGDFLFAAMIERPIQRGSARMGHMMFGLKASHSQIGQPATEIELSCRDIYGRLHSCRIPLGIAARIPSTPQAAATLKEFDARVEKAKAEAAAAVDKSQKSPDLELL
jgi:hypothetical protein